MIDPETAVLRSNATPFKEGTLRFSIKNFLLGLGVGAAWTLSHSERL